MNRIDRITSFLWILFGPGALLGAFFLLLYRAAPLLGRPAWVGGLGFSILLSCGIVYFTFKELLSWQQGLKNQIVQKEEEMRGLRSVLDETHSLYKAKIEKLEQAVVESEREHSELQTGFEKMEIASKISKNQAFAFQTSLEEALEELRSTRQVLYLLEEEGKAIPKDLLGQHKQLRQQFEEKSLVLEQTRRRLFTTEGHLLALKKEQAMEMLICNEGEEKLLGTVRELFEENSQLEEEVVALENLLSISMKSKERKPKKELEKMLELELELQK